MFAHGHRLASTSGRGRSWPRTGAILAMWSSSELGAGYAVVGADGTIAPPVRVATSDVIWNLGIGAAWDGQAYMLVWGEHSDAGWVALRAATS